MKKTFLKICAIAAAVIMTGTVFVYGAPEEETTVYKVGICNYVDDASLNQIVDNIQSRLEELGAENNVTFEISYQNSQADSSIMNQIIADFIADNVDLMVGVATPVAMAMQAARKITRFRWSSRRFPIRSRQNWWIPWRLRVPISPDLPIIWIPQRS